MSQKESLQRVHTHFRVITHFWRTHVEQEQNNVQKPYMYLSKVPLHNNINYAHEALKYAFTAFDLEFDLKVNVKVKMWTQNEAPYMTSY